MNTNQALCEMYRRELPGLRKAMQSVSVKGFSYPQLIQTFPGCREAQKKLFAIGQETKGWGDQYWGAASWHNNDAALISEMIKVYNSFHLGSSGYSSPFWRAVRQLQGLLNPSSPQDGFVWSNLVKIDQDGGRPEKRISEVVCRSFPVLPLEIEIVSPDVVVFFSGHRYDDVLMQTFAGAQLDAIPGYDVMELCRVIHTGLPEKSFRTYHPHYLSRRRTLPQIVSKLSQLA